MAWWWRWSLVYTFWASAWQPHLQGTLQPQCPLIRSPICLLSISLSKKQKQHSTAEGNKPRTTAVKIIFNRFTLTSFTMIHFNVLKILLSLNNFGQQRSGRVLQPAVCLQYSDTFLLRISVFSDYLCIHFIDLFLHCLGHSNFLITCPEISSETADPVGFRLRHTPHTQWTARRPAYTQRHLQRP